MSTASIIPATDDGTVTFYEHLASKIDAHAATLGLPAADVTQLKADALTIAWIIKILIAHRAAALQLTAFRDQLLTGPLGGAPLVLPVAFAFPVPPPSVAAGCDHRTRALIQRIKKSPAYTVPMGHDLGIIATVAAVDTIPKPTFKAIVHPQSEVRLDWTKHHHTGVRIQTKRGAEADWSELGKDNYSPFLDARAPVTVGANETRHYRMRYFDKDVEVGDWSDTVTVVTKP